LNGCDCHILLADIELIYFRSYVLNVFGENILKNLERLLDSDKKNYLESFERLLLINVLEKSKVTHSELSRYELDSINKIIKKYSKFLN